MQTRRGRGAALLAITLLALALRLFRLDDPVLWLDEAFSWQFVTRRSLWNLLFVLPLDDPHPPLYYLVLSTSTTLLGTSEFALRLPSVVFGVLAVPAVYLLSERLFDRRIALTAAALLAVAPFHIVYSQDARMYTLLVFFTVLSMYFLVTTLERGTRRDVLGYLLATALLGYTHVFALFVIAAQGWYVLLLRFDDGPVAGPSLRRWVPVWVGVALALSPWLAVLVGRVLYDPVTSTHLLEPPGVTAVATALVVWVTGSGLHPALVVLVPLTAVSASFYTLQILPLGTGRVAAARARSWGLLTRVVDTSRLQNPRSGYLLLVWTVLPLALALAVSYLFQPIWHFRYTIAATVGFYLLVVKGIDLIRPVRARHLVFALLFVGFLAPLPGYYAVDPDPQWDRVASDIRTQADTDDLVLVSEPNRQVPFNYYYAGGEATVLTVVNEGYTGDESHIWLGQENMMPITAVERGVTDYDDVWLVVQGPDRTPAENQAIADSVAATKGTPERTAYQGIVVYRFADTDG